MGYALWLVPPPPQRHALENLMAFRPSFYGPGTHSLRSFPKIYPHITLATFPSVPPHSMSLSSLLPNTASMVPVHFESFRVGDNYLGSMSITVSKTDGLMRLHHVILTHLKDVKGIEPQSRRFPHMSLFYMDESVRGERHWFARELLDTGRIMQGSTEAEVVLNCPRPMSGFDGAEIWLVDCTGSVAEWEVLEKGVLHHY